MNNTDNFLQYLEELKTQYEKDLKANHKQHNYSIANDFSVRLKLIKKIRERYENN